MYVDTSSRFVVWGLGVDALAFACARRRPPDPVSSPFFESVVPGSFCADRRLADSSSYPVYGVCGVRGVRPLRSPSCHDISTCVIRGYGYGDSDSVEGIWIRDKRDDVPRSLSLSRSPDSAIRVLRPAHSRRYVPFAPTLFFGPVIAVAVVRASRIMHHAS